MYFIIMFGKFLTLIFPRSFCYSVAWAIARLRFYTSKKDRDALRYNLSAIVKDKSEVDRCAKEALANFSYYLVDFFRHSKVNGEFIKKYVKVDGKEEIDRALAAGKGVIALTAHMGNYELGGAVISFLGYSFSAVALAHKNKRLNDFFNRQRRIIGVNTIPTGIAGARQCINVLKDGKVLAILGDRDFAGGGVRTKMFSRPVLLPRGEVFLAAKTKALVLPTFLIRENTNYYRLIFEKPIICDKKSEEDIIGEYACILEKYIKAYPSQWYMFQKCWLE